MAPDPWLSAYDDTHHLAQEIAEKIHERNRYLRNGENPVKVNVALRSLMQNLNGKLQHLRESLLRSVSMRQITQLEGDRRQNLVDELLTKEKRLQMLFKSEGVEPDVVRSSLMTGGTSAARHNPWLLEEPEETRGLGFGEIRVQQQRIIAEQDAGLEALSSIIARQKQMGQDIGNELDEQNEIIDDLTNLVENTDSKVRKQTHHVKLVDKKSGSCAVTTYTGRLYSDLSTCMKIIEYLIIDWIPLITRIRLVTAKQRASSLCQRDNKEKNQRRSPFIPRPAAHDSREPLFEDPRPQSHCLIVFFSKSFQQRILMYSRDQRFRSLTPLCASVSCIPEGRIEDAGSPDLSAA
ncbi:syntaxin-8 [Pelodytes ibericus]